MTPYEEAHEPKNLRYHKILWFILILIISFVSFIGGMMTFYYYDIMTPWGLLIIVPFTLVVLPWLILKMLPWLSRKITGDRSYFDLRRFAAPQPRATVEEGNEPVRKD
jgi:hypothetical protein